MEMTNSTWKQCVDDCLNCYRICHESAFNHCLETGGAHVEPEHFRLMADCAQICRASADFMLRRSAHYTAMCALCAEVCTACATSCEALKDMEECAKACRRCADSCTAMVTAGHQ